MKKRMWLHLSTLFNVYAYPVELLSSGKRFARVKLLHKTCIHYEWHSRGTIKHRVPLVSISELPAQHSLVSQGGGRFK